MNLLINGKDLKSSVYEVKEGDTLNLNIFSFDEVNEAEITINVHKNGTFNGAFADFSTNSYKIKLQINLLEEGASASWHLASNCKNESRRVFDTNLKHFAPNTVGLMSNYGICQEGSRLIFDGTSEIVRGAINSSTKQASKIIVFDDKTLSRCSPILKIDENNISASHSAILGRLNEDQIYYLQSRGLSLKEARRILTLAILRPILDHIFNEELKTKISDIIEGGF